MAYKGKKTKIFGGLLGRIPLYETYDNKRNKIIFEEQIQDEKELWHKILFDVRSWLKTYQSDFIISFQQCQVDPGI